MTGYLNIIILGLVGISAAQECGIGSQCRTLAGVQTCTACPASTVCIQWTTSSAFYCQYTFCLPQAMYCGGRVGTCCGGLECGLATNDATLRTCNAPATTTTTSTTTTTTTTTTTSTTPATTSTTTPLIIIVTHTTTTTTTKTTTTTPAIIIVTSITTNTPTTITTTAATTCKTEGGAKIGLPCVFPFTTKGVTYTSCTTAGGFAKPWCSTATDSFGNHMAGNWGDCNTACTAQQVATTAAPATCNTTSGEDNGKKCVFPFTHKGVVHKACTYAGGFSKPWCSTRVDYWGRHMDGYWGDCDTAACKVETLWG